MKVFTSTGFESRPNASAVVVAANPIHAAALLQLELYDRKLFKRGVKAGEMRELETQRGGVAVLNGGVQ